jgi:hypothetical protein
LGEHSKENGKPEGHGVFVSDKNLILGRFDNGKFSRVEKSIIFDKLTCQTIVYGGFRTRPGD